ncbi:MAG: carotenoid biosynthesis protein [Actinomycetota bacterium]|nr:carotenoid biosynthesis protein [Actinomycetota bacterium]
MDDVDPRISKLLLVHAILAAVLNLADAIRTRGPLRAAVFFALSTGLPAVGELLVTGPFGLLRHRTRPRLRGVPLAIPLFWYGVIYGVYCATERALSRLPMDDTRRREVLPPATALVATNLDLILDPFGLDAGLWEWKVDGAYAAEVWGVHGRSGVPLLNYWGWMVVVMGVVLGYTRLFAEGRRAGRLPALLLLPYYLAAAVWAVKRRRPVYLLYSALFPLVLYLGSREQR